MSDPEPPSSAPVIFDTPTLGRAVRLGELYDQRSRKFLGVQLYAEDQVKEVVTDVRHTELTVSLSTTTQQKATLLDINAHLSLDILGGLISASGSASYLNDEKSNTNEYAYALALKMRLKKKRLLFAESEMGRRVFEIVEKDYLEPQLATHFISSIVYGGNYIVNLVARQSEMSKEEKIEGKLQASFNKLNGAISLSGSVDANIKGEFSEMDDKFDLVVHGDVALEKVPITPKDVLDTFPDAASLIVDGGGVPISVTLQPIPPELLSGLRVYRIEETLVDTVLLAFAGLDDLHSRFLVLQDTAKRLRDFVPRLAETIRTVTATYIQDHSKLLHDLVEFPYDYKHGEKPDHGPLLEAVNELYLRHLRLEGERTTQYPSTLVGLEEELSRFQYLITDVRTVREPLKYRQEDESGDTRYRNDPGPDLVDRSLYLSGIEDVCRAIRTQKETLIFVMTPIYGDAQYDLSILVYLAIVRKYAAYFEDYINVAHMFYAEGLGYLTCRLGFPEITGPSVFAAKVDEEGIITWDPSPAIRPPSSPAHTFALEHKPRNDTLGDLSLFIDGVDTSRSYTIHISATEGGADNSNPPSPFLIPILNRINTNVKFLTFRKRFGVQLEENNVYIGSKANKKPGPNEPFTGTFVQDTVNEQWLLYLDGDEVAREPFTRSDLPPGGTKLRIVYPQSELWWDGELQQVRAWPRALTKVRHFDWVSTCFDVMFYVFKSRTCRQRPKTF